MKHNVWTWSLILAGIMAISPALASADQASTVAALRMNGTLTGGTMPTTSATFATMVADIEAGNYQGAAMAAISTPYFAKYLVRRMAKEMQNVQLTDVGVPDNDATTFVVAHLLNGISGVTNTGATGGISALWSDDVTCNVAVTPGASPSPTFKLSSTQLAAVNWTSQIECTPGQTDAQGNAIADADTGGYTTLSTVKGGGDGSYAMNAFTAGTNLRGIEYIYEIGMGLQLTQLASTVDATPAWAPPFVPLSNPNFFNGVGQPACISCHGGGVSNLLHGYATVADKFDYNGNGFTYIATPSTGNLGSDFKSLGSNSGTRSQVLSCITKRAYPSGFTTCDPESVGASNAISGGVGFTWDLSSYGPAGILANLGWNGPTSGTQLKSFGQAFGQANLVYQFMTQRVINEICPTGSVSAANQASYAAAGQAGDSFAAIVAGVASDPNCR